MPGTAVDAVVLCCSDHRLEQAQRDKLRMLGIGCSHIIQKPGGPLSLSVSLASDFSHMRATALAEIGKALELTRASVIVCISHDDCGAYQPGRIDFLSPHSRRNFMHRPREHQAMDVRDAAAVLQRSFGPVTVLQLHANIHVDLNQTRMFSPELILDHRLVATP